MNPELRNRIVLPIVLPLLVLLGVAVAVGGFALVMLYTTRTLALTIAIVVASGIMVAMALANSIDEEDMTVARRGAILAVALLPLLAGIGIALWSSGGGVDSDTLNINAKPALVAPEGALVGAKNDQSFCVFADPEDQSEAGCEDTGEVSLPAQPEGAPFLFEFNNLQSAIQHNFQIFELDGDASDPSAGAELFGTNNGSQLITGPDETLYTVPADVGLAPGEYYYNCIVHPVMQGVLTIAEGESGEGGEEG